MTLSQSIRSLDFFENLSDEQIDVLSNFSFISKYEKDSILFYETDLKTNLLFLVPHQEGCPFLPLSPNQNLYTLPLYAEYYSKTYLKT